MEYLFLDHLFRWLIEGVFLTDGVPQTYLEFRYPTATGTFTHLRISGLTDPEAEGSMSGGALRLLSAMRGEHYERNRACCLEIVGASPLPLLTVPSTPYRVPPSLPRHFVYRGLPLIKSRTVIATFIIHVKSRARRSLFREKSEVGRRSLPLQCRPLGGCSARPGC